MYKCGLRAIACGALQMNRMPFGALTKARADAFLVLYVVDKLN